MPVYNAEQYLRTAIESILRQTFTNFEFLIVNDGSTDKSGDILQSYTDPRVKIITQSQSGLVSSLNRLLDLAQGTYIARMDADDESAPTRFAEQLSWFKENPNGILVGSWTEVMDEDGHEIEQARYPLADSFCRIALITGNAFAHGAVMFRRGEYRYRKDYNFAEDYDLWRRLATLGTIGNMPRYLYHWRTHSQSISHQNTKQQLRIDKKIQREYRKENLLPEYTEIASGAPREVRGRGRLRTMNSLLRFTRTLGFFRPFRILQLGWLTLRILVGYRTQ